jgi:hypothetical protein
MASMIQPYKGRKLISHLPVRVYRNLHKPGVVYSVWQKGRVVAHTEHIALQYCRCYASKLAAARMRITKRKEVHAWIEGIITTQNQPVSRRVRYNAYLYDFFYDDETKQPVVKANYMLFNEKGVYHNG